MLDTSCRIAADPEVVACPFGDGLALLDLRSGQYFTTNSVGSFVWSRIEHPTSVADLRQEMERHYDVAAEQCARDLDALLRGMVNAKLASANDAAGA
jgi:hypothetical protein